MARDMHSRRRLLAGTALTGVALVLGGGALANPVDPTVAHGDVGFTSSGSVLEIRQGSDKAIIDWRGFDIAAGEVTRFVQPGSTSIALNRVGGGAASVIDGALTANGRIFVINPNGILFGAGASVDVGALVASTADIANDRFLAGDYRFDVASTVAGATIANAGVIKTAGVAALVAPQVRNSGTIQAAVGSVTLGAAQRFTLDLAGDGLISFDAGSAVGGARLQQAGLVQGARVVLSAATAARVVDNVIDMTGVVEARGVRHDGGDIVLDGGQGGVSVAGTLDAGSVTGGGSVQVKADQISINANLTVKGALTATAGAISVGSGVTVSGDGAQTYAGDLSLAGNLVGTGKGAIGLSGALTVGELATIVTAGNAGDNVTVGSVNGTGFLIVDAGAGTVALGTVGATQALAGLSAAGSTVALGSVTTTGLQDYAGTVTLNGNLVSTTGGSIRVGGPVTLAGDSAIVTAGNGGDDVNVTGTVNGAYALQVDAGKGRVAMGGAVGATSALKLFAAGGSTVSLGSVTTTGLQDYAGTVTLNGNLVSTTGGTIRVGGAVTLAGDSAIVTAGNGGDDVNVTGAVNGAYALQVDAGKGRVAMGGPVGATSALKLFAAGGSTVSLGSVTTMGLQDYAGTVTLNGNLVSTTGGAIRLGGPVTLAGDSAIVTAGNGGDDIAVTGSVNGAYALQVDAGSGRVAMGGAVGAASALKLFAAGGSTVSLGSVTTTGQQDYAGTVSLNGNLVSTVGGGIRLGGPVTLTGNSAIVTAGNGGDDVNVTGAVNGAYALQVDAGQGNVALAGAVGGTNALTSFAAGGKSVTLRDVKTTGGQDYAGAITLAGDLVSTVGGAIRLGGPVTLAGNSAIVTAGYASDAIHLGGTVNGAYSLIADAGAGTVTTNAAIGGTRALTLFAASGSKVALGDVTTTGRQDYAGVLTLNGNLVSTVGGGIRLAGPVTLSGDSAIVTAGFASDDINVAGSIDGSHALLLDAGAGKVAVTGAVGTTSALKLLSAGGAAVALRDVRTTGLQDYAGAVTLNGNLVSTTGGAIRVGGPLTLAGDSAIVTAGNGTDDIRLAGTVDGAYALVIDAGQGHVGMAGNVGATNALKLLSVGGSTLSLRSVKTTSQQDYAGAISLNGDLTSTMGGLIRLGGPVTLAADSTITTAGAAVDGVAFASTLAGPYRVTIRAGAGTVGLGGAVSGLTGLDVTGGSVNAAAPVSVSGDLTLTAARLATASLSAATITISGTESLTTGMVTATQDVKVTAGKGATLGAIGGRTVTVTAGDALTIGAITATQDVGVTGAKAVTLGAVSARNLTATAGTSLRLAGVTAETAVLSGATAIASTGPLTLSRTLLLDTAGTATGLEVRTGALTYRGTGRFNTGGSVAGVSGQDAADLVQVAGARSGAYLFADRPVFGVASLVERHRLDIPLADTIPADGDASTAPLILDPAAVKDDLITFQD